MSLNKKVAAIVITIFVLSGLVSLYVQQRLVMPSFVSLERDGAARDIARAIEAVNRELVSIGPSLGDWSSWTDTHEYALGRYPEYPADNLDLESTMPALEINFMALWRPDGESLWARVTDLATRADIELDALTGPRLPVDHPLLQIESTDDEVYGLLATATGPMLVYAMPILDNNGDGPVAGVFAMGRFLDAAAVERLAAQTRLALSVAPASESAQPNWDGDIVASLRHESPALKEHEDRWHSAVVVGDLFGQPLLELAVETPKDISLQGQSALRTALMTLAATGFLTMIVLWTALQRVVLRPLSQVSAHAARVGASDDLDARLETARSDEIGVLARNFDQMVVSLADARRKLVDQSYRSGVSETATGVLHNIGNAITPLTVKLASLSQRLRQAPTADLERAMNELQADTCPADRRAKLERFVALATNELGALVERSADDAAAAGQLVDSIRDILTDQERSTRAERVIEAVALDRLIDEAAARLVDAGHPALRVEIDNDAVRLGRVRGTQAALQQVITNIVINAAEAVAETGSDLGRLSVTAATDIEAGEPVIRYRFTDNGVGVAREYQDRLFERGFSTKARDGSGHGLHWSANTVRALGGALRFVDEPRASGACFELTLPAARADAPTAPMTGTDG